MTNKNASQWRYATSVVSVLLMVVAILTLSVKGLNFGQDFTGGVVSEVRVAEHINSQTIVSGLSAVQEAGVSAGVSVVSAGEQGRWMIRFPVPDAGMDLAPLQAALTQLDPQVEILNTSMVGPQVGKEMVEQGGLAMLICLISIMAYLSFRFEWRQASGALLAMVHDVLLVLGLFSLLQLEVNLTVFAALLAVIGYSLNDSIVIADRVRELLQAKAKTNTPLADINNQAIVSTLTRTLITSGTTLMTISALWLLGGSALEGFAITMFFGILVGTWSSISMGTCLPELLKLKAEHYLPEPLPAGP
ncbi:protein translocase subunit SecF [Corallincola luteus]|uniref:protein translocase subunit SecF n=1 Tax=Corallincola luteus TaxID=1775177 RepID=UPI00196AE520|nr:protein translocase subunit SecF [Corallincola luteus]